MGKDSIHSLLFKVQISIPLSPILKVKTIRSTCNNAKILFKEPSRSESGGLLAKYLSPKKANFLKGMAGSPDYQKYIIPGTLQ